MDEPADEIKSAFDRIFREMDEAIYIESLRHHEQPLTYTRAGASTGWLSQPARIFTPLIPPFQTGFHPLRSDVPETRKMLDEIADEECE